MGDPVTWAIVLGAAGTAVGVAGTIQSGRAQAHMASYNAQVAERDAKAAEQQAAYEEAQLRREGERIKAAQRARYAKSGVKFSGSPLAVMENTAAEIERDALAIRYGGDINAARSRSQAELERFSGKQARTASYYKAGGSLLTGGSKAAAQYSKLGGGGSKPTYPTRTGKYALRH